MRVRLPLLAILMSLAILAEAAAGDPSPLSNPDAYQSLADVPEEYHDGEKLTGCFIRDSTFHLYDVEPRVSRVRCNNPFYWDEDGNLRNWDHELWDKRPAPIQGLPDTYKAAPCKGCLNEQQVVDVVRVYHRGMALYPLGYRASIVRDFPWDGRSSRDSRDGCYLRPKDPYPDLTAHEKVNLPRSLKRNFADHCKEPLGDLTWRIEYQLGWIDSKQIVRQVNAGRRHESALNLAQLPRVRSMLIHAKTGKTPMNHISDSLHLNAWYDAHQRLFLYLPDSPMRELWDKTPTPPRTRSNRDSPLYGTDTHFRSKSTDSRFGSTDPSPKHSNTTGTGTQHILLYWGENPNHIPTSDDCFKSDGTRDKRCAKRVLETEKYHTDNDSNATGD